MKLVVRYLGSHCPPRKTPCLLLSTRKRLPPPDLFPSSHPDALRLQDELGIEFLDNPSAITLATVGGLHNLVSLPDYAMAAFARDSVCVGEHDGTDRLPFQIPFGRRLVPSWKEDFSGWGGVGCGLRSSRSALLSQHLCSSLFARAFATLKGKTDRRKRDLARREFQLLRRKTKLLKATLSLEERLLWRLRKAHRKKYILLQRLKKYELEEDPEPVHDPELITAEQLQALKKVGYKNRNYVPVGRRGVYGGVVQNMHMHWKFHETVQVDCHIFKREDVRSVARQLAILSGGIVIDIHQATTIIMYRGRNYKQPKKQMIPPNTLTKRKALFKSKHLQAIEGLDMNIQSIEADLQVVRRKQQKDVTQGAQTDASKLLEVAGDQAEEDRILANLSSDDLEEEDDDEDDDGIFSWGSDSLDEDELSDVDEVEHKATKVMHEEKIVKPVSWTSKDSAPVKGKKKRMTAKELILAEQELFRNRRQAETAQKTGPISMQGHKATHILEANVDKCLLTDDEDNIAEKGDGISEDDVLNKSEAATRGKVHSGIKNKKIAKFMEDFESDSEEDLGPDFDDLDDLDKDEANSTANKGSKLSDDEK